MRECVASKLNLDYLMTDEAMRLTPTTMRVGLRLWGLVESDVTAWLPVLPMLEGLVSWKIICDSDTNDFDMVIHLVHPSKFAEGSFCWNCLGANEAIRHSKASRQIEMALFAGDATCLPAFRTGCWTLAGARPMLDALIIFAHAVVIPQVRLARFDSQAQERSRLLSRLAMLNASKPLSMSR